MKIRLLALFATACAIGCTDDPVEPSDPLLARLAAEGCPVPSALAPAGWTSFSGSAFRFRVPDEFGQVAVQPVDSETGLFRFESSSLTYDYGPYSSGLVDADRPPGTVVLAECETTVRGRRVQLAVFRVGDERVAGAWWPNLGEAFGGPAHLSLTGRSEHPHVVDELLATLLSVQVL